MHCRSGDMIFDLTISCRSPSFVMSFSMFSIKFLIKPESILQFFVEKNATSVCIYVENSKM